ncbi:hypothetical protein RJ639_017800 [Escallonia herrerae]|uniref:MADS-box domain-containing protein n=1 Tax=Escallonia herrerae TaxID=1293975 RepID=A0AA89AKR3_9ASTE|nr:hypothetical protein RJ639_017800 [Escallonia herrerae]
MEEGKKRKRWHEEKAMDLKMKASYVRRKTCIKKKAMELSTLCNIQIPLLFAHTPFPFVATSLPRAELLFC